jgi:hypothetical protein
MYVPIADNHWIMQNIMVVDKGYFTDGMKYGIYYNQRGHFLRYRSFDHLNRRLRLGLCTHS